MDLVQLWQGFFHLIKCKSEEKGEWGGKKHLCDLNPAATGLSWHIATTARIFMHSAHAILLGTGYRLQFSVVKRLT